MKQKITHTRLAEVCEVINVLMGLQFPVERWDLFSRNLAHASLEFGFEHFDEFIDWLLSKKLDQSQIRKLATFLTISETYFWREPTVFNALTDFIIPEILKVKQDKSKNIRIWSAGCSTGEEPYSLAIALREVIPDIKKWHIQILATDLNPTSLEKAKKGIYTQWSFRNIPEWIKKKYFQDLGEGKFRVIPSIRNMVTFAELNLATDNFPDPANNTNAIDILFCRNVLMYFSDEWVNHIANKLHQSLLPEGWFAVASCELSTQRFPQFTSVNFPGAVVYRKGTIGAASPLDMFHAEYPYNGIDRIQNPIEPSPKIEEFNFIPDAEILKIPIEILPSVNGIQVLDNLAPTQVPKPKTDILTQIRILADEGNLPEALALCEEGIKSDKLAISLYFIRASILQELNKSTEAITSLKQTIYMDSDFVMGHFALGNLYHRQGNSKLAMRHFRNALDLIKNSADNDALPESDGLSVKYIREIILSNMEKNNLS